MIDTSIHLISLQESAQKCGSMSTNYLPTKNPSSEHLLFRSPIKCLSTQVRSDARPHLARPSRSGPPDLPWEALRDEVLGMWPCEVMHSTSETRGGEGDEGEEGEGVKGRKGAFVVRLS